MNPSRRAKNASRGVKTELPVWPVAVALLAFLLLWSPAAAQIGLPPEATVEALALAPEAEAGEEHGWARTGSGMPLRLETRGSALARVAGEGLFDEATIAEVARVVGVATSFFEEIEGPVVAYLRQNLPALAGAGRVHVGVGGYRLMLDVVGEAAPYRVMWAIELHEVPEEAFLPTRNAIGPADARYVIRDFSDLLCGYCARFTVVVLPVLEATLLVRGDVRFEFHHLVLGGPASNSSRAAEASECVTDANPEEPEAFWRYLEGLFERQQAWARLIDPEPYLVELVGELGLSDEGVADCLADGAHAAAVAASTHRALALGLTGTPTLFVGPFRLADYGRLESYLEAMALIDAFAEGEGVTEEEEVATDDG